MPSDHSKSPSDSKVQQCAESQILENLANGGKRFKQGCEITLHEDKNITIQPDGVSEDGKILVEAFARQGRLKSAQVRKISQDILKLALWKKLGGNEERKAIIAFANQEARDSISGWIEFAAETFGVCLQVVDIDKKLRTKIMKAQDKQRMVNASDVANDVTLPPDVPVIEDSDASNA